VLGGPGLGLQPGSAAWWGARPLWMAVLVVCLVPFMALFVRFERAAPSPSEAAAWRLVIGSLMVCGGLALLALDGIGGEGALGIRSGVILLALAGSLLAEVRLLPRRQPA